MIKAQLLASPASSQLVVVAGVSNQPIRPFGYHCSLGRITITTVTKSVTESEVTKELKCASPLSLRIAGRAIPGARILSQSDQITTVGQS